VASCLHSERGLGSCALWRRSFELMFQVVNRVPGVPGGRCVVAGRSLVCGEVVLCEEPCYHFEGPLARASLLAVAAFDQCEDKSFLQHFVVPERLLDASFEDGENPVGPDSSDVCRLVRGLLEAQGFKFVLVSLADTIA
jgi:hypothetical protein